MDADYNLIPEDARSRRSLEHLAHHQQQNQANSEGARSASANDPRAGLTHSLKDCILKVVDRKPASCNHEKLELNPEASKDHAVKQSNRVTFSEGEGEGIIRTLGFAG